MAARHRLGLTSLAPALSLALVGCASVSFAPHYASTPDLLPASTDVKAAGDAARSRAVDFVKDADELANAPQAFDLPTMVAGITALGSSVFNGPPGIVKGAGVGAAGLLTGRSYYKFSDRQSAYLLAASADACLASASDSVAWVDVYKNEWGNISGWAAQQEKATPSDATAAKIDQIVPLAEEAPRTLSDAIFAVEIQLRRKMGGPSVPPNFAQWEAYYKAQIPQQQANSQTAQDAANDGAQKLKAANVPLGQNLLRLGDASTNYGLVSAQIVSNTALVNNLTSLKTTVESCKALIS